MSIEQKIVYAGLSRMTDDRVVIKNAFEYWQANFSGAAFDVVDVTSKLVSYLGLGAGEKKVLMIAMHAASSKAEVELADVPGFLLNGAAIEDVSAEPAAAATINYTPHFQITHGFVKGLVDGVRQSGASSYAEMDEILRDEGLPDATVEQSKLISEHGFSDQIVPGSITENECRDLAHALYLLVIDVIGPVNADVIVTRVTGELMTGAMASRFDPRSLL